MSACMMPGCEESPMYPPYKIVPFCLGHWDGIGYEHRQIILAAGILRDDYHAPYGQQLYDLACLAAREWLRRQHGFADPLPGAESTQNAYDATLQTGKGSTDAV